MIKLDRLKQIATYDPVNGGFLWTSNRQRVKPGGRMGTIGVSGYRQVVIDGRQYREHRLVWLWHHGSIPKSLDHVNRIRDDNRIENLRPCTDSQNQANSKTHSDNSSGYRGVSYDRTKERWVAKMRITLDKVMTRKCLGCFDTAEEAAIAYNIEVIRCLGEFASPSKIDTPLGRILGMD